MKGLMIAVALLGAAVSAHSEPAPAPAEDLAIVFYSDRDGNKDVYLLAPGETEPRNLTRNRAADLCPTASPDGRRIAFLSDRDGGVDIYDMKVDGTDVRRLTASAEAEEHPEYTPDGSRILFMSNRDGNYEIYTMAPVGSDGAGPVRLTDDPGWDGWASFVPSVGSR